MEPRRWIAFASIALAVVAIFFPLQAIYVSPDTAPGRGANQETTGGIPSNPDTANSDAVPPKQP